MRVGSFVVILFLLSFLACFSRGGLPDPLPPNSHVLQGVPFVPQSQGDCGPAALTMLLKFLGEDVDEDEISKATRLPGEDLTTAFDLEGFARGRGLSVRSGPGNLDSLKNTLREGKPIIVLLSRHFAVVIGYLDDGEKLILHSGGQKQAIVGKERFLRAWEEESRWMMFLVR